MVLCIVHIHLIYLKKFNVYKDPLAYLNEDWVKISQKPKMKILFPS